MAGFCRIAGPAWDGHRAWYLGDPASAVLTRHAHGVGKIFVVLRGHYWEEHAGVVERVDPTDVLVRPPNVEHANQFGPEPSAALRIDLDPSAWRDSPAVGDLHRPAVIRRAQLGELPRRMARALQTRRPRLVRALTHQLLDQLLASRRRASAPAWLVAVRRKIQRDVSGSHTRAALASEAGVHPVHLAQSFRRHFGTTVDGYVHRCRIFSASEAILSTGVRLSELASALGFYDQSHLARVFSRERGLPPGAFRRRATLMRV